MIVNFVRGMDLGALREDPKTVAAVERKLLLISEAAIRLGEDADRLCPGLPWHNIRGIGNWLRHRYDSVDVETVWNTVIDDLPPLRSGVLRALKPPLEITPGTPQPIPHYRQKPPIAPANSRENLRDLRKKDSGPLRLTHQRVGR